ncbi:putative surface protease GP63, putative,metallopeptidase, partial [Trypanosoma theileri]
VAAHEIAHALGFNVHNMEGKSMLRRQYTIATITPYVVSQNTRRAAKLHYNCVSDRGLPLQSVASYATVAYMRSSADTPESTEMMSLRKPMNQKLNGIDVVPAGESSSSYQGLQVVEKYKVSPGSMVYSSHWSRRIAKDELMVGLVGAGYYTALTLGAFADLGYYKVNWTMAEQMSWGNNSGCGLLEKKCVEGGRTKFPDMFCTTESTEGSAGLQCTSDRQSLGTCTIQTHERDLPGQFQYFSDGKLGGNKTDLMDYCPIIVGKRETSCTDGDQSQMPGSLIAANSRCVQGENLIADDTAVGAVCVEVSCKKNEVSVRYSGNDNWYSCPEGGRLAVKGNVLQGKIVCPKYADVCNTINRVIDKGRGRPMKLGAYVDHGNDGRSDGSVTAAILVPLLFIFLAVFTIMAP